MKTSNNQAILAMVTTTLSALQIQVLPVLAADAPVSSGSSALTGLKSGFGSGFGPTTEKATVDADAALKSIGPLHLSEGKVLVQQNLITVFSDASDSQADAELSGAIIDAHITDDAAGSTVHGTAIFMKGFSIAAIDHARLKESVKCTDGNERVGRIVDATPKMLRIRTGDNIQAIPTRFITEVKSPRAFAFSLPVAAATRPAAPSNPQSPIKSTSSSTSLTPLSYSSSPTPSPTSISTPPSASTPSSTAEAAVPQGRKSFITFSPTYIVDASNPLATPTVKTLHAQLTEHHTGKQALKMAALTGGIIACFAIPTCVALICPRPRSASAASSNSGGAAGQ